MLLNCGEDYWRRLLRVDFKIKPVNPKGNQCWIFTGRTYAEAEAPILWPPDGRTDSLEKTLTWERLKAGGEGDDRGWVGWMASPTQWTWVWASSRSSWWTRKPGMLRSMGLQRAGHNWVTELTDQVTHIKEIGNATAREINSQKKVKSSIIYSESSFIDKILFNCSMQQSPSQLRARF